MGRKRAGALEFFCCMPVGARLTPEDRLRRVWSAGGPFPWPALIGLRCGASFNNGVCHPALVPMPGWMALRQEPEFQFPRRQRNDP